MSIWIRSFLYYLFGVLITPPYFVFTLFTWPLPPVRRQRLMTGWSWVMLRALYSICDLRCEVIGLEHIPKQPCVFMCKHQSAWETMALQLFLPPVVFVAKKELRWIPFFGWGLIVASMIFIDRSAGKQARERMFVDGKNRIEKGLSIVVFPEGTRIAPGARGQYKKGGVDLAARLEVPVVPIAHNAGVYWPPSGFRKYPGVIRVVICPAIDTTGQSPASLIEQVELAIESEVARFPDGSVAT